MSDHPPAQHDWYKPVDGWVVLPYCRICGIVQRRDGNNKPCKGPTKLREPERYIEERVDE